MTVTGPIGGDQLGITLPHEHLQIDLLREYRGDGLLNDSQLALLELEMYRAAGGRTIVDCTSVGLRPDPSLLERLSRESDVQIIMGCGLYRDPYIDRDRIDQLSVDGLAQEIITSIEVGIDGTAVRAGIIGEIGSDRWYISAVEERSFRAAARAHLKTGLTITTHAARWPVGIPQLDLLREEGVDPRRVIVGHCDTVAIPEYHEEIARRGAFVEFDTVRNQSEYDNQLRVELVKNMIAKGLVDKVLLSHDVCLRTHLASTGGCGFAFVLTTFAELLRGHGVSADELNQILIDNPRRALTGVS